MRALLGATAVCENLFVTESDGDETTRWFGENVRAAREDRGWRQADVVKAMQAAGWDRYNQATHSRTEEGTRTARIDEAVALAQVFECRLDDLLMPPRARSLQDRIRGQVRRVGASADQATQHLGSFLINRAELRRLLGEVGAEPTFAMQDTVQMAEEVLDGVQVPGILHGAVMRYIKVTEGLLDSTALRSWVDAHGGDEAVTERVIGKRLASWSDELDQEAP